MAGRLRYVDVATVWVHYTSLLFVGACPTSETADSDPVATLEMRGHRVNHTGGHSLASLEDPSPRQASLPGVVDESRGVCHLKAGPHADRNEAPCIFIYFIFLGEGIALAPRPTVSIIEDGVVSRRAQLRPGQGFVLCARVHPARSGGTVGGAGVAVAAGGGQAGVADGLLHEVRGGAMVEARDMGVAQPVGRDGGGEAGAGAEQRGVGVWGPGVWGAELHEGVPDRGF
jgi:hypothetical protein